jgi:hypothetical protein
MAREHSPDEIAEYRRRTREVLDGDSRDHTTKPGRDWLGNRWTTGASKINVMLLTGATMAQMSQARGEARKHIVDLRDHMGLPVVCEDEVWRFERSKL